MSIEPMRPDDPMRQSGAVWCDDHDRWECSRNSKQSQSRCHGSAIRGRDRCRMHAGRSAALEKVLGEGYLAAWSTEYAAADAPALDPGTVVLQQLRVAVMRADGYGELVRIQIEMDSEPGNELAGLVGTTYTAGRDGQRVETGEKVRALVSEELRWREAVVRFAKTAHDMGIAERHVELEQERASLVTSAFRTSTEAGITVLRAAGVEDHVILLFRDEQVRTFLSSLGAGEVVAGEVTS